MVVCQDMGRSSWFTNPPSWVFVLGTIAGFLLFCAVLSLAWPLLARLFTGGKSEVAMPVAEEV